MQDHRLGGRGAKVMLERARPKARGGGASISTAAGKAWATNLCLIGATVCQRCGWLNRSKVMLVVPDWDGRAHPLLRAGNNFPAFYAGVAILLGRSFCA